MAKKITKTKESFTVKDFKMWLLGMTEFQEAGWTPNSKQWKTILDKVDLLQDDVQYIHVTEPQHAPVDTGRHVQPSNVQPSNVQPSNVQAFDISNQGVPGGVDAQSTARFHEERPRQHSEGYGSTGLDSGIIDGFNKSFV